MQVPREPAPFVAELVNQVRGPWDAAPVAPRGAHAVPPAYHAALPAMDQTYKLPYALRASYIAEFDRIMTRRAVALIKYIETMMYAPRCAGPSQARRFG